MTAIALLLAAAFTSSADAADLSLTVELPRWNTPVGRYLSGVENVSAPDLGLHASVVIAPGWSWSPLFGYTVRGGRTRANTPMAQFRWDIGVRRMPESSCNLRPYLELGGGGEVLWFADPAGGSQIQIGGGPSASVGALFDETGARGLVGLRATAAWMPGAYTIEKAELAYRFQPSNAGLALVVGKLF